LAILVELNNRVSFLFESLCLFQERASDFITYIVELLRLEYLAHFNLVMLFSICLAKRTNYHGKTDVLSRGAQEKIVVFCEHAGKTYPKTGQDLFRIL
jgi:hypothetical protein